MRGGILILSNIAKRCVSKDEAIAVEIALAAGMALTVLAPIACRRLSAMAVEPVIDAIGLARHGIDDAIRRNVGAGIKIRRPVIVKIDVVVATGVTVMVMRIHVGRK
jgi:hypothetical protein